MNLGHRPGPRSHMGLCHDSPPPSFMSSSHTLLLLPVPGPLDMLHLCPDHWSWSSNPSFPTAYVTGSLTNISGPQFLQMNGLMLALTSRTTPPREGNVGGLFGGPGHGRMPCGQALPTGAQALCRE